MQTKFDVGDEILSKGIIRRIRITPDGITYSVAVRNICGSTVLDIDENDIVKCTKEELP